MPFYERRRLRLAGYDYATPGAYFVTVVIHQRRLLLGDIVARRAVLNAAGTMISDAWQSLPERYRGLTVDVFVVMPNHIHGILWLPSIAACPTRIALPAILRSFKSLTTCRYVSGVKSHGWSPFDQHLWQRNYYERVVRDDFELGKLREYIHANPARWTSDSTFPTTHG